MSAPNRRNASGIIPSSAQVIALSTRETVPPSTTAAKGWFSRCPAIAVFDPRLTDGELRALAAAGAHARRDGLVTAAQATLARRLGVSRQTLNRWFVALAEAGYLQLVRKTVRSNGSDGPNVYRLIYPLKDAWPNPSFRAERLQHGLQRAQQREPRSAGYDPSRDEPKRTSDVLGSSSPGATARMTE